LAQFRPEGTLDPAFGAGGKVVVDVASGEDYFARLALQRDGRAMAAGVTTAQVGSDWTTYPVLCRITSAGKLDRSFGKRGVFRGAAGGSFTDLALQRDDKAVTAGLAAGRLSISRFTRAGKTDASFGTRGSVVLPAGGAAEAGAILVEPVGKIVAATAMLVSDTSDEELVITRRLSR
ncbi:MAG: enzyme repeat protein, partial [Armatimonadetes bacterium]|nr:enzyme repeat protein [Armatimonadota bacterium]